MFFADKVFVALERVVDRQKALQIDFCAGRADLDFANEVAHSRSDAVGADAVRHVVDAAEDENLSRFAVDNRLDAVGEALDYVRRNAAIFDVRITEQFRPFATVGLAVAEKHDVGAFDGQQLEERGALVVEFVVDVFLLSLGA